MFSFSANFEREEDKWDKTHKLVNVSTKVKELKYTLKSNLDIQFSLWFQVLREILFWKLISFLSFFWMVGSLFELN